MPVEERADVSAPVASFGAASRTPTGNNGFGVDTKHAKRVSYMPAQQPASEPGYPQFIRASL